MEEHANMSSSEQQLRQALHRAIDCDERALFAEAIRMYKRACLYALEMIKRSAGGEANKSLLPQVKQWLNRAEALSTKLVLDRIPERNHSKLKEVDVVGMESVKQVLMEAIVLPVLQPQVFVSRKPWRSLLLYGPPGTGKTAIARAVCKQYQEICDLISISPSDVMSKYMGDSEKRLSALFKEANASPRKRCVVFIDEIDALGRSRREESSGDNETQRRVLLQLLKQMDECHENVLVIGATNAPQRLDSALRRRFERRIYVPLPSREARARIIASKLGNNSALHSLTESDLAELAARTEMYSGADLSALCNEILLRPIRTCLECKRFTKSADGFIYPVTTWRDMCTSFWFSMDMMDKRFEADKLRVPPATMADALVVLQQSKPSVSAQELDAFAAFTKQFGEQEEEDNKVQTEVAIAKPRLWTLLTLLASFLA